MKLNDFKGFLLLVSLFTSTLTFGSSNIIDDREQLSASLSRITLVSDDNDGHEDAFTWQNTKHFKELVSQLAMIAEREFTSIIEQLISLIKKHRVFFQKRHGYVRKSLQETIFSWMKEDVLSKDKYEQEHEENEQPLSDSECASECSDEGASWGNAFIRGYERSDSDESASEDRYDEDEVNSSYTNSSTEENQYEEWQLEKLRSMLSLHFKSIDEFNKESIDPYAIERFLKEHVKGGYSWLLNEEIEGTLQTSWDFVDRIKDEIAAPKELLNSIFGNLWFDYDWEKFDFDDPNFMAETYIQILSDLHVGKTAKDVKKSLLSSIHQMFTFNPEDFEEPFKGISLKYNEMVKKNNWRGALIEWSIYTTYRKVFETPSKKSKVKQYTTTVPALPIIQTFNREPYLTTRLEAAYTRARETYTKVYPHPQTRYIAYGKSTSLKRTKLDIHNEFIKLKKIGMYYESLRSKGKENIFVPSLYFIVSKEGNKKKFVEVPLNFPKFPKRALTRHSNDGVFIKDHADDEYYFGRVKHDVVEGSVLQGKTREDIKAEVENITQDPTSVNCTSQFVHSERVMMEFFRNKSYIQHLCDTLVSLLTSGLYKVHGVALLGYSTNTICPNCTPTLIYLQNSRKRGEFLNLLISELISIEGKITFQPKGYDPNTNKMDWSKFRLNTFITAKINFDSQAHDLADEGQHSHTKIKKAPKDTHNPHAKLFFPNNEISLSESPVLEDGTRDPYQRFFYEFVGKDVHTDSAYKPKKKPSEYPGIVFSSGS